jgi:hypothetical protein
MTSRIPRKPMKNFHLLLVCIVLFCSASSFSQSSIYGRVWDPANTPLGNGYVIVTDENIDTLYGETISLRKQTRSSPVGSYRIEGLPADTRLKVFAFHEKVPSAYGYKELVLKQNESRKVVVDIAMNFQDPGKTGNPLLRIPTLLKQANDFNAADKVIARLMKLTPTKKPPALPTRGLVACYPFNGNANDESGHGNNGNVHGGVTSTSDRFGNPNKAYSFNGIDGYIRVKRSTSLMFYSGMSISLWFQPMEFAKTQDMVSQWADNSGPDRGYCVDVGDQEVSCNILSNSNLLYYAVPNFANRWYSVVVTWNGSVSTLYLDGAQVTSRPTSGTFTNQNTPLGLGADLNPVESFFHGKLDDVRIYNRALSSVEIQRLYHENGWRMTSE